MPVKGKNSDWLKSLEGKSPLFSRAELEYIAEVKRRIIEEAKSRPKSNFGNDWSLKYKLPVMKENFEKVVEALEGNLDAKEYFLNTYPEWRTVRDLTVKQLKEIAKKVNQNRQDSTAVQRGSSVISIVGGLICLATGGVALRLLGTAFMGLGTWASVEISATEIGLLEKHIKRAEKIIEEDRKYSEKLWNWISDVSLIQGALDTIRNIDVDENVKKSAMDFHANFKEAQKDDLTISITETLLHLNVSPKTWLMCLVPGLGAVRIAGSVLMGLGSLAAAGISFLELELLRQKIKEAEKIMLEDKRYSERLWNWISDGSHIQEALDNIKNIDVDINLKDTARNLYICFKMSSGDDLKNYITKALNSLKIPPHIINEVADVIGILITTYILYDRYRSVFNVAFETFKCKIMLNTACNVVVTSAKMMSAVNAGRNTKLSNFHKTRLGIGIALDILSIILAAKDMDSTSKESIEIRKAAQNLEKEAEIFKNLYDALRGL